MNTTFSWVCGVIGLLGGLIAAAFGGWTTAMTTLLIFMAIDYGMGLLVAGIFRNSKHSLHGGLESRAGWKGICRKGVTLLVVLVAARLDIVLGTTFVKDAVVIAYIVNELISIIENAGLMGVPIPKAILNAIDILKSKSEDEAVPYPTDNGED